MAYSVTMIIMMVVLYKTLPQSMSALQGTTPFVSGPLAGPSAPKLAYRSFGIPNVIEDHHNNDDRTKSIKLALSSNILVKDPSVSGNSNSATPPQTGGMFRNSEGRLVTHETARTYLDQVIAINFLTLILYSLAFYAAHRELYTLTLAFTSTLSFTMSKYKIC